MPLLVTTLKNEAPYILEWVAYHRMIGFDAFLVYSNDCEDGTDLLLDALAARGLLTHVRNQDYEKRGVQWTALHHASNHPLTKAADWILCADIDEFVNIKVGAGTLNDLFAAVPEADAFTLTWRLFGNDGELEITPDPVLDRFTRAAPFPCHALPTASQFKTLFRNTGTYRKLGVHRPKTPDPARLAKVHWANGSGARLPQAFAERFIINYGPTAGMDLVCLNHYSLKSAKSFLVKAHRGLPNRKNKPIDVLYWAARNFNSVEERSIQRHMPALKAQLAVFQSDTALKDLSEAGLRWHQARADALLETIEGVDFLMQILGLSRTDIAPDTAVQLIHKRMRLSQMGAQADGARR